MGVEKYHLRIDSINSLVCVGLDSDFAKLPERFLKTENPQFEFNKYLIGETNEYAASYKLNSAFYEARGDQGIREMKMTMEYLQENHPDIFTIDDAKRADIGNTNNGYVSFIFDWLGFDAVTVNPYLGKEALEPFLARSDKVSIVLCRTSNPGSGEFQNIGWEALVADCGGKSVRRVEHEQQLHAGRRCDVSGRIGRDTRSGGRYGPAYPRAWCTGRRCEGNGRGREEFGR